MFEPNPTSQCHQVRCQEYPMPLKCSLYEWEFDEVCAISFLCLFLLPICQANSGDNKLGPDIEVSYTQHPWSSAFHQHDLFTSFAAMAWIFRDTVRQKSSSWSCLSRLAHQDEQKYVTPFFSQRTAFNEYRSAYRIGFLPMAARYQNELETGIYCLYHLYHLYHLYWFHLIPVSALTAVQSIERTRKNWFLVMWPQLLRSISWQRMFLHTLVHQSSGDNLGFRV